MAITAMPVSQEGCRWHVPLAPYTTWQVGGLAQRVYFLSDLSSLSTFFSQLPCDEPITWLGLGSNVLIRDGGIAGTTVMGRRGLTQLQRLEGNTIFAEAAVSCAQLARFAAREGLGGAEFLASIPGTVGGALRMNAGCFGGEIWQLIEKVVIIDRFGQYHTYPPRRFTITYRHVKMPLTGWFIKAYFRLKSKDKNDSIMLIRDILARRHATQPTSQPSCGSVFRNPKGERAGHLIERSGLKGYQLGQAMVSPKHANFIVNCGGATAQEIEELIDHVIEVVEKKTTIRLVREVKIMGHHSRKKEEK